MSINLVQKLLIAFVLLLTVFLIKIVTGESPPTSSDFRILAPQFICPRETSEENVIVKPDSTTITLQTKAGADLYFHWIVRWKPLFGATQRFTLMAWDTVRVLEVKLNAPQRERYVYVIDNKELLRGIEYTFNVTGIAASGELGATKYFSIDNTRGEHELHTTEGRADLFSIVLLGSQTAYADVAFVIEAQVTTCHATQDYYFVWQVQSVNDLVDTSYISGSRLEIPPYVLKAGLTYNVICQIIKLSNGFFITQSNLLFTVVSEGLEIYTSVDHLIVTANRAFTLESMTVSHDYRPDNLTYLWECTFKNVSCDFFQNSNDKTLTVPSGLPEVGRYKITVTVAGMDQSATAAVVIEVVKSVLPVIQIDLIQRVHNEGKIVSLTANASDLVPSCKLTWYYASQEFLTNEVADANDTCTECQHGEAVTESVTLYSLEENFLKELIDFTNETEWRQVSVDMAVTAGGRARFVAECGCSLAFHCDTEGTAYADIMFFVNRNPISRDVMVSPESGTALETVFRISTSSAIDSDMPLRYSFYCRVGTNDTLLLASYTEYLAVDTVLPYVDGATEVWVEVCDIRDACSVSTPRAVVVAAGSGHSAGLMLEAARAHLRRCEVMQLWKVVVASLVTYYLKWTYLTITRRTMDMAVHHRRLHKAGQTEILSNSAGQLLTSLSDFETYNCTSSDNDETSALLNWINDFGP